MKNNMIADYFNIMQDYEYLEFPEERGFVMYRIEGKECHVGHFYVKPEFRRQGNTAKYGEQLAKIAIEKGCDHFSGILVIGERPPEVTSRLCRIYLEFGCHISHLMGNCIIFKKDLK